METDYYMCEDCGNKFPRYTRFCPHCNGEKTLLYKELGALQDLLTNILSVVSPEQLQEVIKVTFPDGREVTLEEILQEIKKLGEY